MTKIDDCAHESKEEIRTPLIDSLHLPNVKRPYAMIHCLNCGGYGV